MPEWRCFLCGKRVIWGADFMFEEFGMDADGIVHTFTCSGCGAEYEVYDAIRESLSNEQNTEQAEK